MPQVNYDQKQLEKIDSANIVGQILIFSRMMGPAWLGLAAGVGGATFVTAASLGSVTGTRYLWVIGLAIIGAWIMTIGAMKVAITTQKPLFQLLREYTHPMVVYLIAGSTLFVTGVFHTTQMYLSGAWLNTLFGGGIDIWIVATVLIVSVLIFPGQSQAWDRVIENSMKLIILLLMIALIADLFFIPINWGAVIQGIFIPRLPRSAQETLLVTGVIGAGFALPAPIISMYGWTSRGWDVSFIQFGRWEVHVTRFIYLIINWVVIIVFAFTLHQTGQTPQNPTDAALALKPLIGQFAFALFGFGLWAAVISSIMMQVTLVGHTISDLLGWEITTSNTRWKAVAALTFIPGVIVPFLNISPFQWTVFGSALNNTFMVVFVFSLIYLLRSKAVMGKRRISGRLFYGMIYALIISILAFIRFWAITL